MAERLDGWWVISRGLLVACYCGVRGWMVGGPYRVGLPLSDIVELPDGLDYVVVRKPRCVGCIGFRLLGYALSHLPLGRILRRYHYQPGMG